MTALEKRWFVSPKIIPEADQALRDFPPILRQILYNRGYSNREEALAYLNAHPASDTNPFQMIGMQAAVDRLCRAVLDQEPVAIYGDYDVDGVTATTLLVQVLQGLGGQVRGYIPNRFEEGYGLNNEALSALREDGVTLIVTVDCGIRSIAEAEHARQVGIDLIITDHHTPGLELPPTLATINPKQAGDPYPEKELAGVGLAYKLAEALLLQLSQVSPDLTARVNLEEQLDLVALGTVADLAPLVGENRSLVRRGLRIMRRPQRQGLMALMGVASVRAEKINAQDIGFALGPRLNAAGRLDSALAAYNLLSTPDLFEAGKLAQQLDNQNRERQQITREIQLVAEQMALVADPAAMLLFADDPAFNSGVVGLAAARLSEHYYRPAIVAFHGDEFTRGSCRSIPEFHITQALDGCEDLLVRHGGHAMAAGFTVRNENLDALKARLLECAHIQLAGRDLRPMLNADLELPLSTLHPDIIGYLDLLQPTGYGNQQAIFVTRNLGVVHARAVGKESNHLKLTVTDGWLTFDGIAFRQGHWQGQMPPRIDLMYTFEINEFNGRSSLQLNVRDLKPAGAPD